MRLARLAAAFACAAVPVAVPAQARLDFPPIEQGFFAVNQSCAQAIADDGRSLAYFSANIALAGGGVARLLGFERLAPNRYQGRSMQFNDSNPSNGSPFVLRITGRNRFVIEGERGVYTHCPTERVPADVRDVMRRAEAEAAAHRAPTAPPR